MGLCGWAEWMTGERGRDRASPFDLSRRQRIHVVGVGGAGMSPIAAVLAAMGHTVTGSDIKDSPVLERLAAAGVAVTVGHAAEHVAEVDAVVHSSAVPEANVEVVEARRQGHPVLIRAEILAAIAATRRTVAVAGTHGKTTTSSLLALALVEARLRPSFIVGGELNEIGTGAVWDSGDWLVVEADESDGTFLALAPEVGVVTSVEPDHLEHYGGFDPLVEAFRSFLAPLGPRGIVCADDPVAARLAREVGATTYGTSKGAHWRIVDVSTGRSGSTFQVEHENARTATLSLPIPGLHNVRNAAAALVAALGVGAGVEAARSALARFAGVARRFQFRGTRDGVTYVDDYAHLPGEVAAILSAARLGGWSRVVCVFQPHRYSRTESLWASFAHAFVDADVVIVTDVYPAGEPPRPGVSGQLVADAVRRAYPEREVIYLDTRQALVDGLTDILRPGDLCLTLGAGDLTSLPDELLGRVVS
jgi:UDP-N-acetylmuramate--alanine ligase